MPKVHESGTDVAIPAMSRGALYPDPTDPKKFWLFGGATATDNATFIGYQIPQPEGGHYGLTKARLMCGLAMICPLRVFTKQLLVRRHM